MRCIFYLIVFFPCCCLAQNRAVETKISLETELQYNVKNKVNWVNFLNAQVNVSTQAIGGWKGGFFNINLISIYSTSKERIADDLQIFSNIDEPTQPLGIFKLGYTQKWNKLEIFGGLDNVNEAYFVSPYASLFTNSSCGIFPTVSSNFTIANSPLSAMCIYMQWRPNGKIIVNSSLYNGVAYDPKKNFGSIFTVNPAHDGVIQITDLTYTAGMGRYNFGVVASTKGPYAVWANIEQALYRCKAKEIGLLLQSSYSSGSCSSYYGVGVLFYGFISSKNRDCFGLNINRARFDRLVETALELTWSFPTGKHVTLQPAFHHILTGSDKSNIVMLRVNYDLDF